MFAQKNRWQGQESRLTMSAGGVGIPGDAFSPARDVRLVEVFLRASRTMEAAAAARVLGVPPTTVHRWRATGGEPLPDEVRAAILAFLVRWSMRAEAAEQSPAV